jgi:hypothetical protein
MSDLNRASLEEITDAGIAVDVARQLLFWGPFRVWEDLLWISDVNEDTVGQLQARGFEIQASCDRDWAAPKRFALSQVATRD